MASAAFNDFFTNHARLLEDLTMVRADLEDDVSQGDFGVIRSWLPMCSVC